MKNLSDDILLCILSIPILIVAVPAYTISYLIDYVGYKLFKYPKPEWILK